MDVGTYAPFTASPLDAFRGKYTKYKPFRPLRPVKPNK